MENNLLKSYVYRTVDDVETLWLEADSELGIWEGDDVWELIDFDARSVTTWTKELDNGATYRVHYKHSKGDTE